MGASVLPCQKLRLAFSVKDKLITDIENKREFTKIHRNPWQKEHSLFRTERACGICVTDFFFPAKSSELNDCRWTILDRI